MLKVDLKTVSKKTKQKFYPYWDWECYHAGMYNKSLPSSISSDDAKLLYAEFLSDLNKFRNAMKRVSREWPKSCEHFLTNPNINRIAWLGQAAMCIDTGISSWFKSGFTILTEMEQDAANECAKQFLLEWLIEYNRKNQ